MKQWTSTTSPHQRRIGLQQLFGESCKLLTRRPLNSIFQQALQINSHYSSSLKPKMTIEKLQKIATSQVEGVHKAKWLRWWNSSSMQRAAYCFLPPNFKEADLDFWLNKATFWAQVVMNLKL